MWREQKKRVHVTPDDIQAEQHVSKDGDVEVRLRFSFTDDEAGRNVAGRVMDLMQLASKVRNSGGKASILDQKQQLNQPNPDYDFSPTSLEIRIPHIGLRELEIRLDGIHAAAEPLYDAVPHLRPSDVTLPSHVYAGAKHTYRDAG